MAGVTTLVTRPEPQASQWAEALMTQGVAARALPLIAIDGPPHPEAVAQLWRQLAQHRLLMFVSPAAVEWFFRLRPAASSQGGPPPAWPAHTLAAAPGPGTASALLATGSAAGLKAEQVISPELDSAQFDSEALWPLLAPLDWQHQRVAIISGGDASGVRGRAWLGQRWQHAGAQVEVVQAYRRSPGQWSPEAQALARQALASPATHVWLLSSSEAIDHLIGHHLPSLAGRGAPLAERQGSMAAPQLRALCTHPRIVEHALTHGFAEVRLCAPTIDSVVQARRSHP